ncbi:cadherin-like beta sandwich domain-containing protein [Candidatus Saccharibacteria bacterium]|nr:cadherin-like beta sandwich domain-containing protein [Candidatus Saccharibacteria bacterium]
MKKIKALIIAVIFGFLIPTNTFASGGFSVSTGSISMYVGESSTFSISASNSAGKLTISSSNPGVASVNKSATFLDLNSDSVTVTGKSAGTATISVVATSDYATYDEEILAGQTRTVTVTVNKKPEPKPSSETNNSGSSSQSSNSNNKPSSSSSSSKPSNNPTSNSNSSKPTEQSNNEEEKTEEEKSSNTNLKEINVEGFELEKDGDTYVLDVDNQTKEIDILAEAESSKASVEGSGKKELEVGENIFIIKIKAEDGTEKEYKLIVNRAKPICDYDEKAEGVSGWGIFLAVFSGILGTLIIEAIIIFIMKKRKNNKNSKKEKKKEE